MGQIRENEVSCNDSVSRDYLLEQYVRINVCECGNDSDYLSHSIDFIWHVSNAMLNYILSDTYVVPTKALGWYEGYAIGDLFSLSNI
jgi:hypothetical protein